LVYILTAVHNFLNRYNLDNLEDYSVVEDKEINKEDVQIVKEESKVAIN